MEITVGILTVSDRCARGQAEDESGEALRAMAEKAGWTVAARSVVPDEAPRVAAAVRAWTRRGVGLVLTTGGTGLSPRDVTPEAVRPLLDKELPGFGERMRREGEKKTPLALLSRSLAGSRRQSLVLCLPGSPKGATESLEAVLGLIEHALNILRGGGHS